MYIGGTGKKKNTEEKKGGVRFRFRSLWSNRKNNRKAVDFGRENPTRDPTENPTEKSFLGFRFATQAAGEVGGRSEGGSPHRPTG